MVDHVIVRYPHTFDHKVYCLFGLKDKNRSRPQVSNSSIQPSWTCHNTHDFIFNSHQTRSIANTCIPHVPPYSTHGLFHSWGCSTMLFCWTWCKSGLNIATVWLLHIRLVAQQRRFWQTLWLYFYYLLFEFFLSWSIYSTFMSSGRCYLFSRATYRRTLKSWSINIPS